MKTLAGWQAAPGRLAGANWHRLAAVARAGCLAGWLAGWLAVAVKLAWLTGWLSGWMAVAGRLQLGGTAICKVLAIGVTVFIAFCVV